MVELKPAYLIGGDDDAKIDAWRSRVRRRAEAEHGPGGLERFDAASADPEEVAAALAALSFDPGTRYVLAEGVEAWKAAAWAPLERAITSMPPDTVLVLLARGEAPASVAKAVKGAGGEVRMHEAPKPREMPAWVVDRAAEQGLRLDTEAARALVASVGPRPQRLARELERLAILAHPETQLSADQVERLAAGEARLQVYDLADALASEDLAASLSIAEGLARAGERAGGLVYRIVGRLREVRRAVELIDSGMPEQQVRARMKAPPGAARHIVARARRADRPALERAIGAFADLELDLRGGGLGDETAFTVALARATGAGSRAGA